MKIVGLKADVRDEGYQYYVVEALLYAVIIYMLASFIGIGSNLLAPKAILGVFLLSALVGLISGEAKNGEWLSKAFKTRLRSLSTHDKIFYAKAADRIFGKWHVVGLRNGKEVFGILREYNTQTNEMLIEDGRWVMPNGALAPDSGWVYLPPSDQIEYVRSIEGTVQ